jgi:hypothetical protein
MAYVHWTAKGFIHKMIGEVSGEWGNLLSTLYSGLMNPFLGLLVVYSAFSYHHLIHYISWRRLLSIQHEMKV